MVNISASNIMWAFAKPKLRKKLGFEKITKCTFIINRIEDTVDIIGYGYIKNDVNHKKCECPTMKLSDFQQVEIYTEKVKQEFAKNNLHARQVNVIYVKVDFIKKEVESDVFYIREDNGKADAAKLKIEF